MPVTYRVQKDPSYNYGDTGYYDLRERKTRFFGLWVEWTNPTSVPWIKSYVQAKSMEEAVAYYKKALGPDGEHPVEFEV